MGRNNIIPKYGLNDSNKSLFIKIIIIHMLFIIKKYSAFIQKYLCELSLFL